MENKFKYSVAYTVSSKKELDELVQELVKLGYESYSKRSKLEVNLTGDSYLCTNYVNENNKYSIDSSYNNRYQEVLCDSKDLFLALAAIRDSDEFFVGEYIVRINTDDSGFKVGDITKITGFIDNSLEIYYPHKRVCYKYNARKVTKEELIDYFSKKNSIVKEEKQEFKIGDTVRIIKSMSSSCNADGDIGVITDIRTVGVRHDARIQVEGKNSFGNWEYVKDLELYIEPKEELIFGKWKVGQNIDFNTDNLRFRCNHWNNDTYYNYTVSHSSLLIIKSEVYKDEEHLCIDNRLNSNSYYMIPKSELINKGLLKEEKQDYVECTYSMNFDFVRGKQYEVLEKTTNNWIKLKSESGTVSTYPYKGNLWQFKDVEIKSQKEEKQMDKKIIGYKLIKPEYELAAAKICGYKKQLDPLEIYDGHFLIDSGDYRRLKEAGVLDLWFEPVYEEEKLEVGKWYKMKSDETCLLIYDSENNGNDCTGFWRGYWGETQWSFPRKHEMSLATKEEIKSKLIAEAKKRGFKEGVKVNQLIFGELFKSKWEIDKSPNNFYPTTDELCVGSVMVYKQGKWAEILPSYSVGDAIIAVTPENTSSCGLIKNHLYYVSSVRKSSGYGGEYIECSNVKGGSRISQGDINSSDVRLATEQEIRNHFIPDITINGYKAVFKDTYVEFGCARFDKEVFNTILCQHEVMNKSSITNRGIHSITLGQGVFTIDVIKQIVSYYKNK